MLTREHLHALEQRIGYTFVEPERLRRALTHSSYSGEGKDNERMEFLGDAVLELCVSEELFFRFPDMKEGQMTRNRASVVCESALFEAAQQIGLGMFLLLGRGEDASGGRKKPSILSDAFEAVICAIFLDGGLEPARAFIHATVLPLLHLGETAFEKDYNTRLQELIVRSEGPDHKKVFTMQAVLDGEVLGEGSGNSKQSAGQEAARIALERLEAE